MSEPQLEIQDWGRIDYKFAWDRQREYVEKRVRGEMPDTIIFCEHNPVVTMGRASQRDGGETSLVRSANIPVFEIERGGHATYHGPGQLVAYPIINIGKKDTCAYQSGVLGLIRSMEAWMVACLDDFGLRASLIPGKTGVWIDESRKIGSIGIAAKHWVSYHGLSLNFATGKDPWQLINPCGFEASIMTDLSCELGKAVTYDELKTVLVQRLDVFRHLTL